MNSNPNDPCEPKPGGELIMVVDDEAAICKITDIILMRNGYQALTASSGAEALSAYMHRDGEIKVVLTDVTMPGMDGVALIRALRRFNPLVRIIASTGQADEARMADLRSLAVSGMIAKPYDSRKLLTTLRQILDAPDGAVQKF